MDMTVDESCYKADFEISQRYITFSAELLRISLLAIGGYGALVATSLKHEEGRTLAALQNAWWLMLSMGAFVVCSAFALVQRFYASDCLSFQISYLRKQQHPPTEEQRKMPGYKTAETVYLEWIRHLKRAGGWLIASEIAFAVAVILLVVGVMQLLGVAPFALKAQ